MISIVQYVSEGFLENLDKKFQQTALAKTVDKANDKIDNFLDKSSVGRGYMKLENATGEVVRQGANAILNAKDRLLRRNFKIRK
ncbi:MAG TPA: hypothetical protein PLL26_02320 [Candidatus Dojkabacteria bacterium]|nr:hypothetical protein [Candidatus Dojkabacteria bacterium]